jgi:pimeloyl-ACP methyl ester carboxylesterase
MATAIGLGSRAYDWVWTEEPSILTTEAQVRALKPLPSIQAVVLAAGADLPNPVARQTWLMLQADLARKLPNSTYRVVEESGHFIHCDCPEVVIAAIRTLVDEIRHATPHA